MNKHYREDITEQGQQPAQGTPLFEGYNGPPKKIQGGYNGPPNQTLNLSKDRPASPSPPPSKKK